ncbi:MAG: type II toxin-antitoxin system RelE/ParE family toxin [candidate division NC10 bacterium]
MAAGTSPLSSRWRICGAIAASCGRGKIATGPTRAGSPWRVSRPPASSLPELRRVHAGHDYVILYTIREVERLILVVRVAHRREAYRHLPKL